MLKWDVGRSPAFNVHSLCLYFLKCTLQSAFGVSSSLCRCGPFGNVLVRHFCVRACVRAISCVQQVVGLWRTWGEQVGENVYTVARFVCNAPEQLHPSLSLSFFFFFHILDLSSCTSAISLSQFTFWRCSAKGIGVCCVYVWAGNEVCDAQLDSGFHLLRSVIS